MRKTALGRTLAFERFRIAVIASGTSGQEQLGGQQSNSRTPPCRV